MCTEASLVTVDENFPPSRCVAQKTHIHNIHTRDTHSMYAGLVRLSATQRRLIRSASENGGIIRHLVFVPGNFRVPLRRYGFFIPVAVNN